MKRTTRAAAWITFLVCTVSASALDWKSRPNDVLRREVVALARQTADAFAGEPIGAAAAAFAAQDAAATNDYAWIQETISLSQKMLAAYPPDAKNLRIREAALRLLDYPLHVDNFSRDNPAGCNEAFETATRAYFNGVKQRVLAELGSTPVTQGAVVWKVYNMGFVVRTRARTFAVDIAAGPSLTSLPLPEIPRDASPEQRKQIIATYLDELAKAPPAWSDEEINRLADALDVLFITHPHDDHFSPALVCAMLKRRKPVVAPFAWTPPYMARARTSFDEIRPLLAEHYTVLHDTKSQAVPIAGIQVVVFPGNQGADIPNNVYLFDADGIRLTHNGDNGVRAAEAGLASLPAAHIILANCWSGMPAFIRAAGSSASAGDARQVVIAGHENEMGHGVSHRESWLELYTRADRLGKYSGTPPVFTLGWGEKLVYPPGR